MDLITSTHTTIKQARQLWDSGDRVKQFDAYLAIAYAWREVNAMRASDDRERALAMLETAHSMLLGSDGVSGWMDRPAQAGEYAGMPQR
jgi:hypothetical protein